MRKSLLREIERQQSWSQQDRSRGRARTTVLRIGRLPVDDQKTMCGADVRKRSTKFIVEHCRSDL